MEDMVFERKTSFGLIHRGDIAVVSTINNDEDAGEILYFHTLYDGINKKYFLGEKFSPLANRSQKYKMTWSDFDARVTRCDIIGNRSSRGWTKFVTHYGDTLLMFRAEELRTYHLAAPVS